ncbi:L-idonate 5-dehydrogenase [Cognatishimia activa]|uniref:L-idonate 5-dehydrogenase n=5 Tax=Alphaproteobacteria TaxID=28211 RepID=A0A0U1NPB6_9RHOB|nr:L-idonate 5-dehydrogenase [Thalassobacter stenotrophicus]CRK76591.1 L-idonate 5-dehydrogenase [Nereida ignava]CUI94396.1 L-idonate 5-dehydrogenase [Cognatishimia activa]SFJ84434.1 L-idonate 5-dehydrogenase [Nereida ignava DSM 16309]CUH58858.1 L-idonate 5-dehydrogenase [Thalassobacter stenotrophicus]CUK25190.1 L-idonate 5-dehydrogenase [Cognatishimia activa]
MKTTVCKLHGKHDVRLEKEEVDDLTTGAVRVSSVTGGICGSDLHYYHEGGFGPIRVRHPITVGHEASGRIAEVGPGVDNVKVGDLVALNPSRPCMTCKFCERGELVHCLEMQFSGSAYRDPHENGFFRGTLVLPAVQTHRFSSEVSPSAAACTEPLSVCLHARAQAPDLTGLRVLVTGSGPIGILCAAVAKHGGASEIVVTDLEDAPLAVARQMGATDTVNVRRAPDGLGKWQFDKGLFDVVFECSAAPPAIKSALTALRPRGTMVMVGVTGDASVPINLIVSKEIKVAGTHRFHEEFAQAVAVINSGEIDLGPLVSHTYDPADIEEAYATASDRTKSVKVHVAFAAED